MGCSALQPSGTEYRLSRRAPGSEGASSGSAARTSTFRDTIILALRRRRLYRATEHSALLGGGTERLSFAHGASALRARSGSAPAGPDGPSDAVQAQRGFVPEQCWR